MQIVQKHCYRPTYCCGWRIMPRAAGSISALLHVCLTTNRGPATMLIVTTFIIIRLQPNTQSRNIQQEQPSTASRASRPSHCQLPSTETSPSAARMPEHRVHLLHYSWLFLDWFTVLTRQLPTIYPVTHGQSQSL